MKYLNQLALYSLAMLALSAIQLTDAHAQISSQDLILHLTFDGGVQDSGPHDLQVEVDGPQPTEDRFGNPNSAYSFDGIDDLMLIPDTSVLNPTEGITLLAWYKTTSFEGSGNNPIFDKAYFTHNAPYYQYHLGVTGDQYDNAQAKFAADIGAGEEWNHITTDNDYWAPGEWHCVIMTWGGDEMVLYCDGEAQASMITSGGLVNWGTDLYIGKYRNTEYFTPGVFDDLRIYGRVLDEPEISHYCNQGPTIVQEQLDQKLVVFPNPAREWLSIQGLNEQYNGRLALHSANGVQLRSWQQICRPSQFYIGDIEAGLYLVSVIDEVGTIVQSMKIVIQ